jgi:hypothetical protein
LVVERTLRRPKRPLAYGLLAAAVAALLAVSVAVTWRMAHQSAPALQDVAEG